MNTPGENTTSTSKLSMTIKNIQLPKIGSITEKGPYYNKSSSNILSLPRKGKITKFIFKRKIIKLLFNKKSQIPRN